ncbi:cysteine hydrolase family protein [Aquabacterium sp.]|uniref:cysteine hydrolase family protein n=1 Tax=Aquabacterium sp. TaxID=1872578 RepID=UPI002B7E07A3|nr:cysteine hydrolase family protein [Aquabacterium sp.]HSW05951.1 cysteine hydrolase family protein [Aquabacterium sp.]
MTTALLVIDVQAALFEGERRPGDASAVIARINSLAERARSAQVPVIYVQHEREDTPLAEGSPGWALARELQPATLDVRLRKTTPDAFLHTRLEPLLQEHDIQHLVICGYASEFCVDTTTRRAAALGYTVTLAADAHTTHDKPHASAEQIRAHENATLPNLTSFGPVIRAMPADAIGF